MKSTMKKKKPVHIKKPAKENLGLFFSTHLYRDDDEKLCGVSYSLYRMNQDECIMNLYSYVIDKIVTDQLLKFICNIHACVV